MTLSRFGACSAAVLLLLAGCSEPPPPPPVDPPRPAQRPLARLTLAQGQVELERAGQPKRQADIEDLFDQDLVATGADARAILKFKGGGEVELAQNSRFRLSASEASLEVDLKLGVISLVEEAGGVALVTPYGRTRLSGETRVKLGREEQGLSLELLVGEITQDEEDGGAVRARAGQKLLFGVGAVTLVEEPGAEALGEPGPLAVEWQALHGAPELKPKGASRFRPAKGKVALAAGTAFKVPGSARARLSAPGLTAEVAPGSQGSLEGAGVLGQRRELDVTLSGGLLDLQFQGDGPAGLSLPSGGTVARVRGSSRARVRVAATPLGARVSVIAGEVDVSSGDGAPTRLRAGQVGLVQASGVELGAVKRPLLTLPAGKRVKVHSVGGLEVGLDLPDEEHEAQVATDPAFKDVILSGRARGFISLYDPPPALYWRALGADGKPVLEGRATFLRELAEAKGDAATFVVRATKANVYFQGELPALTFTWDKVPGAARYRLSVVNDADLKTVAEETVVGEKHEVKLGEGAYQWSVTPLNASGGELSKDVKMAPLKIAFDNSMEGGLAIAGPRPNEKAGAGTRARGVAPLRSKLYVNGAPVPLDDKGRYDLAVGKTSPLVFRLVAADGSEAYWVRVTR